MKGLRLRAAAVFTAISLLSAYSMQLFLGLFYERNLPLVLGKLGSFNVIVAVLIVGANLFFWRVLGPIERTSAKAASGAELSAEERASARRSGDKAVNVVLVTIVLAYVAGPTAGIAAHTALGISSYSLADVVLIFAINFAIGAASGTHIVLAFENLLRGPLESLAVATIGEGERYSSIRGRILLAAGASGALLATFLVAAARGYLDAAAEGRLDPAAVGTQLLESAALAAVLLGWGLWLSATIASGVTARLRSMTARIEAIAEGGGDLSGRARIVRNDDIGRMASSFNRFLDSLERIVLATKGMAREARSSAGTLADSAVQARESVELLGKAQEESRGSAEAQGGAVEEARRRMAAMAASVDSVAGRAAAQALEAERSSAAVGQMAANVAAVSRTAERADETAARLRADSAEGGEALRASLEAIRELEASSKSVREIVASISKIAAQTNLLAMNAAIEAAHAGEAGAGFAVVADEVRSLAGSAAKSAKEIVALIKDMSARIEAGAEKAGRAGAAFDRVREGVEGTGELVRTMAASMAEQRAGAEEILSSVGGLAEAARAIRELSAAQRGESAGVVEAMDGIVAASERILEALQEEAGATSTLSRIVSLVSEESERTREGTTVLAEAVGRFRTREEA